MKKTILIFLVMGFAILKSAHTDAKTNRLIDASSPYLLQHAHNPVDWYPWGEEAFAKARFENKPLLISIGYSTCYWCHVMEREVFEDPAIAQLMNETLVCIKVDREQRPDIDEIYMTATQLLTQSGGWPNNVFVTPDLKPFYAGTYFPPHDTSYRPGFATVVGHIRDAWKADEAGLKEQADRLTAAIIAIKQGNNHDHGPRVQLDHPVVQKLLRHYQDNFDERLGGFYQAPKFPNENGLLFLLNVARIENNSLALSMVRASLMKMAEGGFHDHVGGGFHRYSTDAAWSIPHFEKMLYNQALLGRAFTELYRQSPSPAVRLMAENTFDFVLRQMTKANGGFYSALDAETDAVEGEYYAWREEELKATLDDDQYSWLMRYFGLADIPKIMGHKNSEGRILYLKQSFSSIAEAEKTSEENVLIHYQHIMERLREKRDQRRRPREDDKIIAAWNGMMIEALANAGEVFQKPDYTEAAVRAANFALDRLQKKDGSLWRIEWHNQTEVDGTFEDYAYLIRGLVALYSVTHQEKFLKAAEHLIATSQSLFWDQDQGGYFYTHGHDDLLVRMKNAEDSAIPSGNAIMAEAMLDLYAVTHNSRWQKMAEDILKAFAPELRRNPREYTTMVDALLRDLADRPRTGLGATTPMDTKPMMNEMDSQSKVALRITDLHQDELHVSMVLEIEVEKDWHINAVGTNLDSLIPTSLDVRDEKHSITIDKIQYPEAISLNTPLGTIEVYQGKIMIPLRITVQDQETRLRLLVRAQACKDNLCLRPSDWVIPINLK